MLSPTQLQARDGKLTASRVACLMTGDADKIMALWSQMLGFEQEEDLSGVWPVQLGSTTEALNLAWYERKTGHTLSRHGEVVVHPNPTTDWAACTLDAWDNELACPVEAKHVGGREPRAKVVERYQPQCHWQMIVTGCHELALTIIEGANEPVVERITFDHEYGAELWRRAEQFMACVISLTPPVALEPVAAPVTPIKEYDMRTSNVWGDQAATWLLNRGPKRVYDQAEKELKALVPADAIRCFGHGIEIKRNKAGSLSLREATL